MENLPLLEEWYDGTQRVLDNGMTLWAKSWPSAKKYGAFVGIGVGAMEDPLDRPGCAHCFEHIPFRGAGRFPSKLAIFDALEEEGGGCGASTSLETTMFTINADARMLDHALDVLHALVAEPHYAGVEIERTTVFREYWMYQTEPPHRAQDEFPALFYEDPRLGHSIIGTEESIKTMAPEHLAAFHSQWYSPGRMAATITGPGEEEMLLDALEARFGQLPGRGDGPVAAPTAYVPAVRRGARSFFWDLEETMLACVSAFPAEYRRNHVGDFLCKMLGEGASSPIFQSLREERGYFYTFGIGVSDHRGFSTLGFGCHAAAQRAAACWSDFWNLVKPDTGLSKRRWEWVQRYAIACRRHAEFRPRHVAEKAVEDLLSYGRVTSRNEDAAVVRSILYDEVLEFADQYLPPDTCLQVTFSPSTS